MSHDVILSLFIYRPTSLSPFLCSAARLIFTLSSHFTILFPPLLSQTPLFSRLQSYFYLNILLTFNSLIGVFSSCPSFFGSLQSFSTLTDRQRGRESSTTYTIKERKKEKKPLFLITVFHQRHHFFHYLPHHNFPLIIHNKLESIKSNTTSISIFISIDFLLPFQTEEGNTRLSKHSIRISTTSTAGGEGGGDRISQKFAVTLATPPPPPAPPRAG